MGAMDSYYCDNYHLLNIYPQEKTKCVGCCNNAKIEEGKQVFYGLDAKEVYFFAGRKNEFPTFENNEFKLISKKYLCSVQFSARIDTHMQNHEMFKQILSNTRLEWLKCSLRISRNIINKDICLKIACMLGWEPFLFVNDGRENKKLAK